MGPKNSSYVTVSEHGRDWPNQVSFLAIKVRVLLKREIFAFLYKYTPIIQHKSDAITRKCM